MKAEAAPGLWLRDVPVPEVHAGEVLIRVLRTGICGTDLHVRSWDSWAQASVRPPVVLGHEIAGRIEVLGSGVDSVDVGDLVSVEGHIVCGRCRSCLAGRRQLCPNTVSIGIDRDGGFAEFVAVPATNVWRHTRPIDPDVAAIFDPFGNAVHSAPPGRSGSWPQQSYAMREHAMWSSPTSATSVSNSRPRWAR